MYSSKNELPERGRRLLSVGAVFLCAALHSAIGSRLGELMPGYGSSGLGGGSLLKTAAAGAAGYAVSVCLLTCGFFYAAKRSRFGAVLRRVLFASLLCLLGAGAASLLSGGVAALLQVALGAKLSAERLLAASDIASAVLAFLLLPIGVHLLFRAGTQSGSQHTGLRDLFAGLRTSYIRILLLLAGLYAAGVGIKAALGLLPAGIVSDIASAALFSAAETAVFFVLLRGYGKETAAKGRREKAE